LKLIVGLGNPGREYAATRHNVGWWAVDHLAEAWEFGAWHKDGNALVASGRAGGRAVRLMKPQTFMNLSGAALIPYCRRETWNPSEDLMVIVDEVALPVGRVRLRSSGSAGGHNGLKSIEAQLASRDYARLRIGVGPADAERDIGDLADFVTAPFGRTEAKVIVELLGRVRDGLEVWLRDGIEPAMNLLNVRPRAEGDDARTPQ
jgi:PTH1 family peptidyl-tRNA hydrolase